MKFPDWLSVYGDRDYRGPCPHESIEQIDFFAWLCLHNKGLAALALHPKNEGSRSWGQVDFDKRTGSINKGASDIIIPGAPALVGELKRLDHTKSAWQKGQIDYLWVAKERGCFVFVALGAAGAKLAIDDYLLHLECNLTK